LTAMSVFPIVWYVEGHTRNEETGFRQRYKSISQVSTQFGLLGPFNKYVTRTLSVVPPIVFVFLLPMFPPTSAPGKNGKNETGFVAPVTETMHSFGVHTPQCVGAFASVFF